MAVARDPAVIATVFQGVPFNGYDKRGFVEIEPVVNDTLLLRSSIQWKVVADRATSPFASPAEMNFSRIICFTSRAFSRIIALFCKALCNQKDNREI